MRRPKVAVIVPSRQRAGNVARLVSAWQRTTTGDGHLVVAVDDDDPLLSAYTYLAARWPADVQLCEAPRHPAGALGGTLNDYAIAYAAGFHAVGFMGDDHVPRTHGWDQMVLDAIQTGYGIVYGDDLFQRRALPTAVFMDARIVRALGWMSPPGLRHLYVDNAWKQLGEATEQLCYLPRVVIEHLHPAAGKADMDEVYRRVNHPDADAWDRAAYLAWQRDSFPADAARIREALRGVTG
jgi:hypothetical protein